MRLFEDQDPKDARKLVRVYSLEAQDRLPPDNDAHFLAQVLKHSAPPSRRDALSPWRKFFDPTPVDQSEPNALTRVIDTEARELRGKWLAFQHNCPKDDQVDFEVIEPSIEGVMDLVKSLEPAIRARQKQTVAGKITNAFRAFCEKLDSHSRFLELLPQGSEYVSLFSGSVSIIIKASVNHGKVSEDLANALCAMSEDIADIQIDIDMYRSKALVEKVADLYAHVFKFLADYMDHLMRSRRTKLLDALNQNMSQKFDARIKSINDKTVRIKSFVQQSHRAEGRDTRLAVEDVQDTVSQIASDLRIGLVGEERRYAEIREYAHRMERELRYAYNERRELRDGQRQLAALAAKMTNMLEMQAMLRPPSHELLAAAQVYSRESSPMSHLSAYQLTRDDIALRSAHLEDFFHRDRVRLPVENIDPGSAPSEVLYRIIEWTRPDAPCKILWLEGPAIEADDFENPMTVLAATMIDFSAQSGLPVISYFCELRREKMRGANSWEMQGLTSLVCSLIRQMIELLLPAFDTNVDLSASRFDSIDGTGATLRKGLALVADLVGLLPVNVVCVIDGLHWVDGRETEELITQMVGILRESHFRVLLTTSGRAGGLSESVKPEEIMGVHRMGGPGDQQLFSPEL